MISSDEEGLASALIQAQLAAAQDEVPVGAIIVRAGQIVGVGYNQREQFQNPIAHAEILAIQDAAKNIGSWRLLDCTLYCTLEPCPMCLAASQQARIKAVVYGAIDLKGGALSLGYRLHEDLRTNHRFSARYSQVSGCSEILKEFFVKKRNSR